jgi:hypothetical protein
VAEPLLTATKVPVDDPIAATLVLLLVHVPPVMASVSVVPVPAQNDVEPDIADGSEFTVTDFTATHPVESA